MNKVYAAEKALKWSLLGLTILMILTYFMPAIKSVATNPELTDILVNYSSLGEYQVFYDIILIFPIMSIVLLFVPNRNSRPFAWAFYGFYVLIYIVITARIKAGGGTGYLNVFGYGYYILWITSILSILTIAASITIHAIILRKTQIK